MSVWGHVFKISIEGVHCRAFEIESVLRDDYPSMSEDLLGMRGMRKMGSDLSGVFFHSFDPAQMSIEDVCASVRELIWRVAGRYLEIRMQGFLVEDNQYITGSEEEYEGLVGTGKLGMELDGLEG